MVWLILILGLGLWAISTAILRAANTRLEIEKRQEEQRQDQENERRWAEEQRVYDAKKKEFDQSWDQEIQRMDDLIEEANDQDPDGLCPEVTANIKQARSKLLDPYEREKSWKEFIKASL